MKPLRKKTAALALLAMVLQACGGGGSPSVPDASSNPSFNGSTNSATATVNQSSGTSTTGATNSTADGIAANPDVAAALANQADGAARAKALDIINAQLDRDQSDLELAEKTQVQLQNLITNVQTKKITPDSGAAIGEVIATGALVALGIAAIVATGGIGAAIIPFAGAAVAGGTAISSGVSNAKTDKEVADLTAQTQAQLDSVNKKIDDLHQKINKERAVESQLVKNGAT